MSDLSQLLTAIEQGEPHAAEQLLPLVYAELRELAGQKLAQERPGQTLQATALVHEAYLRLVVSGAASAPRDSQWNSRGHFFAAAAEAMRRILVENARRKKRVKHGGGRVRVDLAAVAEVVAEPPEELLDLDLALAKLEAVDAVAARVVKLRYFAGLTLPQTAETLGVSLRTVERDWTFARTWLHREISRQGEDAAP